MSVKVAVIGTGWAERVQIPAFKAGGLEVVGISGRHLEKSRRIAKEQDIAFATDNWRDLLKLDCDLISVTSPPLLHKEQAIAVLEAGKHLLCEKPLALSAAEAQEMREVAKSYPNQLALVDHELRFVPARLKAKELLATGYIGRILTVTVRVAANFRIDPTKPWNWWSDAAQGGGILGAIGSHVLDGVRWLLEDLCGEIDIKGAALGITYPERKDEKGNLQPVTADDIASASFKMGDAVGTMLVHGASLDEPIDLLTIRGDEGTIILDKSLKLYVGKRDGALKEYVSPLPGYVPNRFRSNAFPAGTVILAQVIGDALAGRAAAETALAQAATLQDGLKVMQLMETIRGFAAQA